MDEAAVLPPIDMKTIGDGEYSVELYETFQRYGVGVAGCMLPPDARTHPLFSFRCHAFARETVWSISCYRDRCRCRRCCCGV